MTCKKKEPLLTISRSINFFSVATFTAMSLPCRLTLESRNNSLTPPGLVGLLVGYLSRVKWRQWSEPSLFSSILSIPCNGRRRSIDLFHCLEFLNRLSKYTASVRSLHATIVDKALLYNGPLIYHHQQTPAIIINPLPT